MADGFLRIAFENMANAIKKVSVQRGYDVTGYTLNCFGGGGRATCLLSCGCTGNDQGIDASPGRGFVGVWYGFSGCEVSSREGARDIT
ncbi:MAG: hypothetical protein Ct9H300mP19_17190 [Dehalococcoidia bacterium]|nr:MAG: hypothetical protein Ct9H300mP19_17190 [Dehalococcoidia bacterium]